MSHRQKHRMQEDQEERAFTDVPVRLVDLVESAEQGEPFAYGSLCEISGATDLFKTDPSEAYMWCGLAMKHLPDGEAKDAARVNFDALKKTIAPADLEAGERAIEKWNAEKDTFANMRNVGDDFN
jgi:hypothetical protein